MYPETPADVAVRLLMFWKNVSLHSLFQHTKVYMTRILTTHGMLLSMTFLIEDVKSAVYEQIACSASDFNWLCEMISIGRYTFFRIFQGY